jgi:predicted amidohydrolase YtcJ
LRAFTYAPAWCNFEEDRAGTLEPGRHADFIVIDRDYLTCPVDQIRDTQVLRTVIAGKTVFAR